MVDIFKALAEVNRLRILSLLIDHDLCVCEIERILNITQSNASRHLTILRQSGLLRSYKEAQWVYYGINTSFKDEHKELYLSLLLELKRLPTYQDDYDTFLKCRQLDICNNCNKGEI